MEAATPADTSATEVQPDGRTHSAGASWEDGPTASNLSDHFRTETALRASLREKEALLHEIHHRVKNNLQVISSLLDLQAAAIEDQRARAAFAETQRRVRSIALVHEQLYRSADMARIDFAGYVRTLADYLAQSYPTHTSVRIITEVAEDIHLDADSAIPCALIINELVVNALKHAFPAATHGTIHIACRAGPPGTLTLAVTDDGIGMPAAATRGESLGLRLVATLVRQLHGTISTDSWRGTTVSITFAPRRRDVAATAPSTVPSTAAPKG